MIPRRLCPDDALATFLRGDPALHVYELGDLDPVHAPHATWWGDAELLSAVALVYAGFEPPVVICVGRAADRAPAALCGALVDAEVLPQRFYAHLHPEALDAIETAGRHAVVRHGRYCKMALADLLGPPSDPPGPTRLGPDDEPELAAFYARTYPGNTFDPRSLLPDRGRAVGLRDPETGELLAVAGTHVLSRARGVGALGNIAVDPAARGRGLGRRVTAALCRDLQQLGVRVIGLNVRADNASAIACYRSVGFEEIAPYEEATLTRRERPDHHG